MPFYTGYPAEENLLTVNAAVRRFYKETEQLKEAADYSGKKDRLPE